jgi:hypothetical protein
VVFALLICRSRRVEGRETARYQRRAIRSSNP